MRLGSSDGGTLLVSVGNDVEHGVLLQVLEALARYPHHVHLLHADVGVVLASSLRALALQGDVELAELAQLHLLSCQEHFSEALHRLAEDGLHILSVIDVVVVTDVL